MSKFTKVNHQIKAPRVMLVMPDGEMRGEVSLSEAKSAAINMKLDLVEVSPASGQACPVCKLMDYGKLKYSQSKKKKSNHTPSQVMKEIKFGPNISDHDLGIKHNKILSFLEKKHKVKYTLELKGRQRGKVDFALEKFKKNLESFKGVATWDNPSASGRGMSVILTPLV